MMHIEYEQRYNCTIIMNKFTSNKKPTKYKYLISINYREHYIVILNHKEDLKKNLKINQHSVILAIAKVQFCKRYKRLTQTSMSLSSNRNQSQNQSQAVPLVF